MGVMDERSSRIFVGVCLLVLLWIGTYWVYDPHPTGRDASISFAEPEAPPAEAAPVTGAFPASEQPVPLPVVAPAPEANPVVVRPPDAAPAEPPSARVVPPEFREHVVREGESFESIARRYFGADGLGSVVARANPLRDPRRLQPGDVVRVPVDPNNVQGRVVREGAGDDETEGGTGGGAADPAADAVVEYRVQPGDTLSRIAQSYYGSVRHADFLFRANRDTLSSPDSLRVGQTLRLPPLENAP